MHDEHGSRIAAFSHKPFVYYWLARFCTTFSVQILSVAVAWQVYDLTRDPLDLGLIGLVQFVPLLLLVLVTGSVADRYGRKRVMSCALGLELVCTLLILGLAIKGMESALPVFVVLGLFGTARAFYGPASQSLVVNLVPEEDFANAISWNSTSWQVATIAGPVAGGLLYGAGPQIAYGATVVLMCVSFALLMKIPEPSAAIEIRKVTFDSLFDGLRYIKQQRVVLGAISLDLFAVLMGGAVALLPVYARDILELGPWGLGLLRAAPGIGGVATAMYLATSPIRDHAGRILLVFVAMFGLCTVIFGLATQVWLSIIALMLIGAADMVSVVIREILLQLWTPDAVRGRVNAVNMVFLGASNELGEFRAGTMAAWLGAVPAVVLGGAGAIAVALGWAVLFPQLKNVRYLHKQG